MNNKRVVGYYTNWSIYGKDFHPTSVKVECLTHLNYAFAKIEDGVVCLSDTWADAEKPYEEDPTILGSLNQFTSPNGPIKRRNPNLKVLISVGGWTYSKHFSTIASSPEARSKFNQSILSLMQQFNLDGVDLDWEFPVVGGDDGNIRSENDGWNFVELLKELRVLVGEKCLVTLATSASEWTYKHLPIREVGWYCDFINLMAYDFTGPWSKQCHHQANLQPDPSCPEQLSCHKAVQYYLGVGLPPHKLVVGVPFYARGFTGITDPNTLCPTWGLGKPYASLPTGTSEPGVYQYFDLVKDQLQLDQNGCNKDGWVRIFNDQLQSVHLVQPTTNTLIGYDDDQSLAWKCHYVNQNNLGGIMVWELYGDYQHQLITAINNRLNC